MQRIIGTSGIMLSSLSLSRPHSIRNALTNLHSNKQFEDPLTLHYLPSSTNNEGYLRVCGYRENPLKTTSCGVSLLTTSGLNPKTSHLSDAFEGAVQSGVAGIYIPWGFFDPFLASP